MTASRLFVYLDGTLAWYVKGSVAIRLIVPRIHEHNFKVGWTSPTFVTYCVRQHD